MTTATAILSNRTLSAERTSRPSLEEPVDRLMPALFREEPETAAPTAAQSVARRVHEARRLRQAGDLEGLWRSSPGWTRQRRRAGPTPSGWTCFGCGEGGVPDFIRRVEGLSLPEAVQTQAAA